MCEKRLVHDGVRLGVPHDSEVYTGTNSTHMPSARGSMLPHRCRFAVASAGAVTGWGKTGSTRVGVHVSGGARARPMLATTSAALQWTVLGLHAAITAHIAAPFCFTPVNPGDTQNQPQRSSAASTHIHCTPCSTRPGEQPSATRCNARSTHVLALSPPVPSAASQAAGVQPFEVCMPRAPCPAQGDMYRGHAGAARHARLLRHTTTALAARCLSPRS